MVKRIVILSHARSGTSRLKQLFFRTFHGFADIDTEFFKKQSPALQKFIIKNKSNLSQNTVDKCKELLCNHNFRLEDPIACLNQLSNVCFDMRYKYLLFKITPVIFDFKLIQNLANESDIKFLFITRNILDTYISYEKALMVNAWDGLNTSNIKLKLDKNKFLKFHKDYINWVKTTYSIVSANNAVNFYDYNDIFNTSSGEKTSFLNLFKSYVDESDINHKYIENKRLMPNELKRQDITAAWNDKISNGDAIESLINNKSLKLDVSYYLNK